MSFSSVVSTLSLRVIDIVIIQVQTTQHQPDYDSAQLTQGVVLVQKQNVHRA